MTRRRAESEYPTRSEWLRVRVSDSESGYMIKLHHHQYNLYTFKSTAPPFQRLPSRAALRCLSRGHEVQHCSNLAPALESWPMDSLFEWAVFCWYFVGPSKDFVEDIRKFIIWIQAGVKLSYLSRNCKVNYHDVCTCIRFLIYCLYRFFRMGRILVVEIRLLISLITGKSR